MPTGKCRVLISSNGTGGISRIFEGGTLAMSAVINCQQQLDLIVSTKGRMATADD